MLVQVSVCPGGIATGYTYFLPQEEQLESRVVTRGYMESRMVVSLAGRCAERLVLGDAHVSTAGAGDLDVVGSGGWTGVDYAFALINMAFFC